MSEAGTRAVVAGFYEDFNGGDIDAAVAAFSEVLETMHPGMGTVHGIEPFREYLQTFKRAMPNARAVVEQMFATGDRVIVEGRFVGTHRAACEPRRRYRADWGDRRPALCRRVARRRWQDRRLPHLLRPTRHAYAVRPDG
jgi:ketosteroid isomerase-like protein